MSQDYRRQNHAIFFKAPIKIATSTILTPLRLEANSHRADSLPTAIATNSETLKAFQGTPDSKIDQNKYNPSVIYAMVVHSDHII